MDALEELLIDFVAHVPPRVLFEGWGDWEQAVLEILAATPLRDRPHRIGLMAKFFRDLDLRQSAVVPALSTYREALRTMVNQRIARSVVDER